MLAGNAVDFYRQAPWMIVFPGLAISASVLAFKPVRRRAARLARSEIPTRLSTASVPNP